MSSRRYTRQIRLAEIGARGQEALLAARVAPAGEGESARVEAEYLRRAGVGVASDHESTGAEADASAASRRRVARAALEALGVQSPGPRDVAEGALLALEALRSVLGFEGGSSSPRR